MRLQPGDLVEGLRDANKYFITTEGTEWTVLHVDEVSQTIHVTESLSFKDYVRLITEYEKILKDDDYDDYITEEYGDDMGIRLFDVDANSFKSIGSCIEILSNEQALSFLNSD